jgi:UDP-glucose 4-epimerase
LPIAPSDYFRETHELLNILVTGAGGFIGSALVPLLQRRGNAVTRWPSSSDATFDLANTGAQASWVNALRGIDVVVHLAAHVHQMQSTAVTDALMQRINRDGTLQLARAALTVGVRRFIFISTAKVFGEGEDGPYRPDSNANPQDAYALSKWQAEQSLQQLVADTAMELVIIRPPLVYGTAAGANFARLRRLAQLPLPLPIQSIHNRRDMIGIDNLIDLIALCTRAPAAAKAIWLCSDGAAYSLADVLRTLRRTLKMPPLLFSIPPHWVEKIAEMGLGSAAAQRLLGNFELDITKTRERLQWSPPFSMQTILQKTPEIYP